MYILLYKSLLCMLLNVFALCANHLKSQRCYVVIMLNTSNEQHLSFTLSMPQSLQYVLHNQFEYHNL